MKKIIVLFILTMATGVSVAQETIRSPKGKEVNGINTKDFRSTGPNWDFWDWYFPANAFINSTGGAGFHNHVRFIMPDSNCIVISDSSGSMQTSRVKIHSIGETLDPKDEIWAFNNPPMYRID